MIVVLPWPDMRLSPNSRMHWAVKAGVVAKARRDAAYATYEAVGGGLREARAAFAGNDPISVRVTFYPPDKRHRDDDNLVGCIKSARDGIADALAINDRRFVSTHAFAEPASPGRVEFLIGGRP